MNRKEEIMDNLLKKISCKNAKVAIIGLGYVGLPLAVEIAKANFKVIGIDKNKSRVDKINNCESYIMDVENSELKKAVNRGKIAATYNFNVIEKMDVIIICVPTPLTRNKEPDMTYIKDTLNEIIHFLHKGQLIILESTTYPCTT
jgi:UDP-N-acetyl-D-glucosamine dehydrogenase